MTNLSPNEIIKRLNEREDYILLNEAGVIFLSTQKEKIRRKMENVLTKALWSKDSGIQYIGYCQLRRANGTASEIAYRELRLFQFRYKPIVEHAAKKLWL